MSTLHGLLRGVQNALQNDRLPQVQGVVMVWAQVLDSFFRGILFSLQVFSRRKLVFQWVSVETGFQGNLT